MLVLPSLVSRLLTRASSVRARSRLIARSSSLRSVATVVRTTSVFSLCPVSYTHLDVYKRQGVTDVLTKSLGTDNAMNIVKAVAAGLQEMQDPEEVAKRRGMSVADLYGWKEKN